MISKLIQFHPFLMIRLTLLQLSDHLTCDPTMSLPTLTSGSLSTTRKSGWRLLPEIHASRLSVSGSLRPKLGLLILSILLLISLCFVLVPVLSKLKFPYNRTFFSPRDLPLQKLYYQVEIRFKCFSQITLLSSS